MRAAPEPRLTHTTSPMVASSLLATTPSMPQLPPMPSMHAVFASQFAENLSAIAEAQRDVLAALLAPRKQGPCEVTTRRLISVETLPELRDHAFYRQPPDWPRCDRTTPARRRTPCAWLGSC